MNFPLYSAGTDAVFFPISQVSTREVSLVCLYMLLFVKLNSTLRPLNIMWEAVSKLNKISLDMFL